MKFEELLTPCYIVNKKEYENSIVTLQKEYEGNWGGKVLYGYSVKTNHFYYMLKTAMKYGFMAEVVSPDEYEFAKICGARDKDIIYNGPQKRNTVLDAVRNGAMVNLDNLKEIELVCNGLSESEKKKAIIGVRVNYDIEAECPGETTCKGIVGRFGISYENGDLLKAIDMLRNSGITISGLHMHQSSSSRSLKIFEGIARKAIEVSKRLKLDDLKYIDMGGGYFGGDFFPGKPNVSQYARCICGTLKEYFDSSKVTLVIEPGAAILATSMDYLTGVLNIRDIRGERVVTLDGSVVHINPFMNPHPTPFEMINPGEKSNLPQIIGGSTCMELDRFYPRDINNIVEENSLLRFKCCGAYMSTHNSSFINAAPNIYLENEYEGYELLREKNVNSMYEY